MPPITIFGTDISIRENRYSLNDLHKAAGGSQNHKPNIFLRNEQTKDLVAEINSESVKGEDPHLLAVEIIKGRNGGTYACEELFVAYAMWLSARVHLAAIQALIAKYRGNALPAQPELPALPNPTTGDHISIPLDDWFEICNVVHAVSKAYGQALSDSIHNGYTPLPRHLQMPYSIAKTASHATGMIYTHTFNRLKGANPTPNPKKLAEAIDLTIAILDDLETETEYPTVSNGMAYRAALDSCQQLLETLIEAGKGE